MKRFYIILIFFISNTGIAISQTQGINNNWIMGYASWGGLPYGQTRIDYFSGIPVISYDSLEMDFRHTNATISDSSGNLLFYTNGCYVADATHDTMFNGSGLTPGAYADYATEGFTLPQGALILQTPGSDHLFELFHCTVDNFPPVTAVYSYHLYKSSIDLSQNSGLGMVTSKNIPIINDTLIPGKIVACKHANGRDWWIVCLKANSNIIYKVLLSTSGIVVTLQSIGGYRTFFGGQAKFSPDGTKFAIFNPQFTTTGVLEIFDFDRCSGVFGNADSIVIPQSPGFNGGMEFSPSSQFLYVCNMDSVFQYDATSANVEASKITVASWDSFNQPGYPALGTYLSQPQLAPDGKIYMATGNSTTYLHVINNPDSSGNACDLIQHGVLLPTYNYNTIPNHPNYFLGCDTISTCPCLTTGIHETVEGGRIHISVAPNPGHDIYTLRFPVSSASGELEVYDVYGNLVHEEYIAPWSQYKQVDLIRLKSGIYICRLKWGDATGSIKIVKE